MHNHPIFLGGMGVALFCVATYVYMTPSLRSGLPMFATQQQQQQSGYVGEYETGLPGADSGGRKIHLSLTNDNKVTMTTDYLNNKPAIVETGDATAESQGILVITLTKKDGVDLPEVQHLSFTLKDDALTLMDSASAGYGSAGLILKKIK